MISRTIPLQGMIERRLLINYRVEPRVASALIPRGLRLQIVNGFAVAGICMIRLGALRPVGMPARIGWRGENVAHRIAVEWDHDGGTSSGVYIPQRHSASWLPVAVGSRLFPGAHQHARFEVSESAGRLRVQMRSGVTNVTADVEDTPQWSSHLFPTLLDASEFFRKGSVGWSPNRNHTALEGLRLDAAAWRVTAARPQAIASSFFDALPPGSVHLDNVLVMRDIPATWSSPDVSPPAPRSTFNAIDQPLVPETNG